MTYVVQQPHSNTNDSDKYQVVKFTDWLRFFGGYETVLPVASSFDTYDEAMQERNRLNQEEYEARPEDVGELAVCGCPWSVILDAGHQEGCEVLTSSNDTVS